MEHDGRHAVLDDGGELLALRHGFVEEPRAVDRRRARVTPEADRGGAPLRTAGFRPVEQRYEKLVD